MDPHDFLSLARELADADTPAHYRTALTRAYYAVYNVACDVFLMLGLPVERGHAGHEIVRERLRTSGVDRLVHVGAQLRRLHNIRVKADYWMLGPQPEQRATVERWLAHAEQLVADLDAVAVQPGVQDRIRRAAQTWEQGQTGRDQ
ncbi:MAG: HEPN domain-containing protein [Chloroflexi bacterium]|nr:HEPN domain-containing protein [Chloroflexota bacterium]